MNCDQLSSVISCPVWSVVQCDQLSSVISCHLCSSHCQQLSLVEFLWCFGEPFRQVKLGINCSRHNNEIRYYSLHGFQTIIRNVRSRVLVWASELSSNLIMSRSLVLSLWLPSIEKKIEVLRLSSMSPYCNLIKYKKSELENRIIIIFISDQVLKIQQVLVQLVVEEYKPARFWKIFIERKG